MQTTSDHNDLTPADSWPMYRALVGVGMVCALLIVSAFVLTGPVIARNEAAALQRAVFQVLPGATAKSSFVFTADNGFRLAEQGDAPQRTVHVGYDGTGQVVGVAIQAQGMGYQDVIRILYGYSPQREAIVGMQVLASKETPGLGDRIEKDPAFLDNFRALDVSLDADGQSLQHLIEAVKSGEKTAAWQIDGITGATISSKAVASILRQSSQRWIALIKRQRGELRQPAGGIDGEQ